MVPRCALRRELLIGLLAAYLLLESSPLQNRADEPATPASRQAWSYTAAGKTGGFVLVREGRWRETTPDGTVFRFTEVARTAESVELVDRTRDIHVHLLEDHCDFRFGKEAWRRLYVGHFTTPEMIPSPPRPPADPRLRIVYFVAVDRQPVREYEGKILSVMRIVADIYRSDLEVKGYHPRALPIEERQGHPAIHLVQSQQPASYYNGAPNYDYHRQLQRILADIPASIADPQRQVVIVFAETYDESPAKVEWPGTLALGSKQSSDGGFGVFSAWILKDELCGTTFEEQRRLLFDETPLEGRTAMGDGRPNSPRFQFIEDGIGAVAHELGHALGLAHDTRDEDRDIMSNGFRNLRRNYAPGTSPERRVGFSVDNARMLMTSRLLATDLDINDDEPPTATFSFASPLVAGQTEVPLVLEATDENELRAAVIFDFRKDSVAWGAELKGREAKLRPTISVRPLAPGEFRLEAYVADGGGNLTRTVVRGKVTDKEN